MKKDKIPKVSVVIPTYNRRGQLMIALYSLEEQSFKDFEIIVVNDGEQRVDDLMPDKVIHLKNEGIGGNGARNTGIRKARGEYIAFLDDDDTYYAERLKIQVDNLDRASKRVGFSFCAAQIVYPDGQTDLKNVPSGEVDFLKESLKSFNSVTTSMLMVKKSVFEDIGLFDEKFPTHQDAELLIRMSKKYLAFGIDWPLMSQYVRFFKKDTTQSFWRIIGNFLLENPLTRGFEQIVANLIRLYFKYEKR